MQKHTEMFLKNIFQRIILESSLSQIPYRIMFPGTDFCFQLHKNKTVKRKHVCKFSFCSMNQFSKTVFIKTNQTGHL